MSAPGPEAPRPLRKPGDTDAVTFSWADGRAGVYGLARVASGLLADGTTSHSVLAVVCAGRETLGAIAEAGVVAQRAALAQTQAALPSLEKQLAAVRHLLATLAGGFPAEEPLAHFDFASLALPAELPVSLPSQLVEQRPDVRAAEATLHAASADVGVASAAMLPQFTLDAAAGSAATQLASLISPGTGFWSLAASAAQPMFQGGTLLHRKRAAEAAYDQAAAQYRSTVLGAFQNVADTLDALRFDSNALAAAGEAERLARESLDIARRQVELGDASYLTLLSAQLAYQQARLAAVQAQANRYVDTAALFQSLGGGWWNRARGAAGVQGDRNVGESHDATGDGGGNQP